MKIFLYIVIWAVASIPLAIIAGKWISNKRY
jgi:uncharacterized protein YneF (UPF0154 family)